MPSGHSPTLEAQLKEAAKRRRAKLMGIVPPPRILPPPPPKYEGPKIPVERFKRDQAKVPQWAKNMRLECSTERLNRIADEIAEIRPMNISDITRAVCKYFRLRANEVMSDRRHKELVYARQIIMYLAKTMTCASYPLIGRRMGDRDHATIVHGVKRIEAKLLSSAEARFDVSNVANLLHKAFYKEEQEDADSNV